MLYHPIFFTATCLEWKKLLKPAKYKNISLLVNNTNKGRRMPNGVHTGSGYKAGKGFATYYGYKL